MRESPEVTLVALASQTVGPFFHFALTANRQLGVMAKDTAGGQRIQLSLRLLDGAGAPVADGMFELWQADAAGRYRHPLDPESANADAGLCGFGRLETDAAGMSVFETVRPGCIADGQSPHINVIVFSRGLLSHLFTRIYFEDDPGLDTDAALSLVPEQRRSTLIAHRVSGRDEAWAHDIHLQGPHETVFFDL